MYEIGCVQAALELCAFFLIVHRLHTAGLVLICPLELLRTSLIRWAHLILGRNIPVLINVCIISYRPTVSRYFVISEAVLMNHSEIATALMSYVEPR